MKNSWPTYGNLMIWLPILLAVGLPLLISTFYDFGIVFKLIKQTDELLTSLLALIFLCIPFVICTFLTRRDKVKEVPINIAFKKWLFRVIPVCALYVFLLVDVTRSAAMKSPGASTASMVLMLFPVAGTLLLLVTNYFAGKDQRI